MARQDPRYCEKDRVRLKLALRGKRLGFSLIEIREVLDLYDTRHDGSVRQLERLLKILADKRANLERQLEDIRIMQRELDQVEERCKGALGELKAAEQRS
ncbi:MerR family DNA-binding protein [Salinicola sp. MIT1003]|uniref:MerR family DNA-binding protein n=1 Tax=Salinicola sp. MIT1003 TaxID=1882734 RepID=UPI000A84DC23|nr:MerR family DNA-binding protein [Salinicola sp. MIT1003]